MGEERNSFLLVWGRPFLASGALVLDVKRELEMAVLAEEEVSNVLDYFQVGMGQKDCWEREVVRYPQRLWQQDLMNLAEEALNLLRHRPVQVEVGVVHELVAIVWTQRKEV